MAIRRARSSRPVESTKQTTVRWTGYPCVGTVLSGGQKKAGPGIASKARLSRLRHLSTDSSNDDGGGGNSGARRTNSKADNSHSTDTAGNSHRGSTHNNLDSQPQFRPKPERQNAARGRKPIHLPPMQLKEAFSYNFPFLFVVLLGVEAPAKDFLDALKYASPFTQLNTRQR